MINKKKENSSNTSSSSAHFWLQLTLLPPLIGPLQTLFFEFHVLARVIAA
jgi:hypothetical protein